MHFHRLFEPQRAPGEPKPGHLNQRERLRIALFTEVERVRTERERREHDESRALMAGKRTWARVNTMLADLAASGVSLDPDAPGVPPIPLATALHINENSAVIYVGKGIVLNIRVDPGDHSLYQAWASGTAVDALLTDDPEEAINWVIKAIAPYVK